MATRLSGARVAAVLSEVAVVGFFAELKVDPEVCAFRNDPVPYRVAMNALQDYGNVHRSTNPM
jgi:hypothetical protein